MLRIECEMSECERVCTYTSHRTSKQLWINLTRTSNYPYISLQADEHTPAQNYHHSVYDPFELIYNPVSTRWNTLMAFIRLHSFSSHTDGFLRVQWSHLYTYLTCHTAHAGSWRQVSAPHTCDTSWILSAWRTRGLPHCHSPEFQSVSVYTIQWSKVWHNTAEHFRGEVFKNVSL